MGYKGVIIEESLENKDILKDLNIINTKIETVTQEHDTPWIKQWTMHTVEVSENIAQEIAEKISKVLDSKHSWYADFKNDKFHFIVFKNKIFFVDRSKIEQYEEAKKYGMSLGIPAYQLDCSSEIVA